MSKDYYTILGVSKDASKADIKKKYRELAKKYHPDKNQGDKESENRFKEISEAYAVLSDPKKRAEYDKIGNQRFRSEYNSEDIFRDASAHDIFSEFGIGDDIFSFFFGGAARGGRGFGRSANFGYSSYPDGFNSRTAKGADYEVELSIPFIEAMHGSQKDIKITTPEGKKDISLKIPRGVRTGKKLRLKGEGGKSQSGSGDIYIKINVLPDPYFRQEGDDLFVKENVKYSTLILGGEVDLKTLNGKKSIKINPGHKLSNKIRIKGEGSYSMDGKRGDLYLELDLISPVKPNAEAIELAKKLEKLGL